MVDAPGDYDRPDPPNEQRLGQNLNHSNFVGRLCEFSSREVASEDGGPAGHLEDSHEQHASPEHFVVELNTNDEVVVFFESHFVRLYF